MSKRLLVLGAGGVGGYFGGRLQQAGGDVTFLVREKRQKLMQEKGLRIESPLGDATLNVKTVLSSVLEPEYDYILIASKAYDLESAIESIRPAVGPETVIIPFLNGMAHMERLSEIFGEKNVFGGTVIIQATLTDEGVVKHFNDGALMFVGSQAGGHDPRAEAFQAMFENAKGLKVRADDNIMQRMWDKWVRLSVLAGMTCLMRANVGEINRAVGGREAMEAFLTANEAIASHYGFPVNHATNDDTASFLYGEQSTATASMLRDLENGARVEGEQILGDLIKRAEAAGIAHPIAKLAYTHVKAYEERIKSGRDKV